MVNFKEIVLAGYEQYKKKSSNEVQIIDLFLVYALLSGILQIIYAIIMGSFPFNSFISGLVSSVGLFIFTVCLRLQITNPKTFGNISRTRAYLDYVICNLILFFIVVTFMG